MRKFLSELPNLLEIRHFSGKIAINKAKQSLLVGQGFPDKMSISNEKSEEPVKLRENKYKPQIFWPLMCFCQALILNVQIFFKGDRTFI